MPRRDKRWLAANQRDPFVRRARQSHYRSRAVFKLKEMDASDRLFRAGQTVFDLGAAPGSWSQFAAERVGASGRVIAVDRLHMEAIENVEFIQGDFSEQAVLEQCLQAIAGQSVDLVISDLAPNLSGIRATDQSRSMLLAELVADFAGQVLGTGGVMLVKLFQGQGADEFRNHLMKQFQSVRIRKPAASRDRSREFYVLASGYNV